LAVLAVASIGLVWWYARNHSPNYLTVENRSGEAIAVLRITAAGETKTFRDVSEKTTKASPFPVQHGDHFVVEGRLADGTRIRTNGIISESSMHVIILPGGQVQFRPAPRRG
jgi:hypothetical protein